MLKVLSVWPSPGIRAYRRVQFWAHFCTTYSDLVWTDLCYRVATSFNMLMTLWCTRHITYFRLLLSVFFILLSVFFILLGLMIPLTKSVVVLSSQRHLQPPVFILIGGRLLQQSVSFKFLGVFFYAELRQGTQTQAKYVQKRCLQRLNLLKLVAGVWWGAWLCCIGALWARCWNITRSATLEWPEPICYGWRGFNIEEAG
jgi:hypothetical protein